MWVNHQSSLLQSISSQSWNVFLSGDGRADSPGHSAKFGSYTVIDVFYNKVVDFKLVQVSMHMVAITLILDGKHNPIVLQSNEVGRSYHMAYGERRIEWGFGFPTKGAENSCGGAGY